MMKKRRLLFLSGIILAVGLSIIFIYTNYTPSDKVRFGYSECMKLNTGEKCIDPIDTASIHEFMKNCSYNKTAIYLNKVISGKNKIIIALSTRLAPQDYLLKMKRDSLLKIFFSREYSNDQKLFHSLFIRKNKNFIFRTLYSEPKLGNMILIDIFNKDSLPILNLYNDKNYLTDKISNN